MSSLYGRFLRHVFLPLGDAVRGVPIGRVLHLLSQSQWWSKAELQAYQSEKVNKLIASSYAHVPAFREIMESHRLTPQDIRSATDLPKLPLMRKDVIRHNYPGRITNTAIPSRHLVTMRTGGSTGEPLCFKQSRMSRAWDRASYYRYLRWCGSDRGEPLFSVWGQLVVSDTHTRWVRQMKLRLVTRQFGLDAFNMSDETIGRFLGLMREYRPKVLRGYTSALIELGRWVQEEGLDLPVLQSIATTAEQVSPEQRAMLESVFQAPVFNQYGCAETGGIAYECDRHAALHIASEHCVVEIVDEDGLPLPVGEAGLVALTNLDNEATPFVRYVNGDVAALLPDSCPCGRGLPLMSAVTGRTADMIIGLNGSRVHGEFFTHLLNESGWTERLPVEAFQVIQTHRDRLEFHLVSGRPPAGHEQELVIRRIQDYLGDMTVDLRCVKRIDRSRSGKQRFTLRLWNPSDEEPPKDAVRNGRRAMGEQV